MRTKYLLQRALIGFLATICIYVGPIFLLAGGSSWFIESAGQYFWPLLFVIAFGGSVAGIINAILKVSISILIVGALLAPSAWLAVFFIGNFWIQIDETQGLWLWSLLIGFVVSAPSLLVAIIQHIRSSVHKPASASPQTSSSL